MLRTKICAKIIGRIGLWLTLALLTTCADKVSVKSSNLQSLELVSPSEGDQVGANRVKLTGWCPVGSTLKITYGSGFSASNTTSVPCQICTVADSPACEAKFNARGKYEFIAQLTGTSGARTVTLDIVQNNKLIPVRQVVRALTYAPLSQTAYLKPSHRLSMGNTFAYTTNGGNAVAVYGDTAVIADRYASNGSMALHNSAAAPTRVAGAPYVGAVYVFRHDGVNWAQEAVLSGPRITEDFAQSFGSAVAIYGDVIVVGANSDDADDTGVKEGSAITSGYLNDSSTKKVGTPTNPVNSGGAYIFRRTGSTWALEASLKAPDINREELFGSAVAISGDRVVVGAYQEDSNQTTVTNGNTASSDNSAADSGAAYVFDRVGGSWQQTAFLKAANSGAGDQFGLSLGVSGDTIVVSARLEDSNQTTITNGATASSDNSAADSGAVYVYRLTGSTWAQEAYIKAVNAEAGDYFGHSVAIDGNTIAVGAYQEDSNAITITNGAGASADNSASSAGAVYVYTRSGTTWSQEAYIKAGNSGASDSFGYSVAIDGDTIAVGANGEDSNLLTITNGTGTSANNGTSNAGAVYVYKRTAGAWAQEAYIKTPNSDVSDQLGRAVAVQGNWVISATPFEDSNATGVTNGSASANNSFADVGAAHAFHRAGVTWSYSAYFKPANFTQYSGFGYTIAADGDTLVVPAYVDDSADITITNAATYTPAATTNSAGSVYVFRMTGATWAQEAVLKAPNAANSDFFGISVAISGDTIAVGADGEDSNQTTITNGTTGSANNSMSASGAVYIFHRAGATWTQQAYIKPSNTDTDDGFGSSVSLDGDTLVVGAPGESSNQTTITNGAGASADNSLANAGAAYVFTRTGVNWAQSAYLKAPNAGSGDEFGTQVTLDGDLISVSATFEDGSATGISNGYIPDDNLGTDTGAIYVFQRTAGNWGFQSYIKAFTSGAYGFGGTKPSIDGDLIAVADSREADGGKENRGAIYICQLSGSTWTQTARISSPISDLGAGRFGFGLALKDNYLMTISYESTLEAGLTDGTLQTVAASPSPAARTAFLYKKKSASSWQLTNYLKPSVLYNHAALNGVAIGTGFFALGAPYESNDQIGVTNGAIVHGGIAESMGSAYIFTPDP